MCRFAACRKQRRDHAKACVSIPISLMYFVVRRSPENIFVNEYTSSIKSSGRTPQNPRHKTPAHENMNTHNTQCPPIQHVAPAYLSLPVLYSALELVHFRLLCDIVEHLRRVDGVLLVQFQLLVDFPLALNLLLHSRVVL